MLETLSASTIILLICLNEHAANRTDYALDLKVGVLSFVHKARCSVSYCHLYMLHDIFYCNAPETPDSLKVLTVSYSHRSAIVSSEVTPCDGHLNGSAVRLLADGDASHWYLSITSPLNTKPR